MKLKKKIEKKNRKKGGGGSARSTPQAPVVFITSLHKIYVEYTTDSLHKKLPYITV